MTETPIARSHVKKSGRSPRQSLDVPGKVDKPPMACPTARLAALSLGPGSVCYLEATLDVVSQAQRIEVVRVFRTTVPQSFKGVWRPRSTGGRGRESRKTSRPRGDAGRDARDVGRMGRDVGDVRDAGMRHAGFAPFSAGFLQLCRQRLARAG